MRNESPPMTTPRHTLWRRSLWIALFSALLSLLWVAPPLNGSPVSVDRELAALALTVVACLAAAALALQKR